MNFLQICQRVNDVVGFQGQITDVTASGYQAVLTTAVQDSYQDIQRYRPDWEFKKARRSINVSDLQTTYTLQDLWGTDTPDLALYEYINYDFRRMEFIPYEEFVLIDFGDYTPSKPRTYTIEPASKSLIIEPVDQVYTLDLHYIRELDVLTANTSVPVIPERHHQLIVYMAIMKLSTYVGNATLYDTYSVMTATGLGQLMREENPAKVIRKRPIA